MSRVRYVLASPSSHTAVVYQYLAVGVGGIANVTQQGEADCFAASGGAVCAGWGHLFALGLAQRGSLQPV